MYCATRMPLSLSRAPFVPVEPAQVELQLPLVRGTEPVELELDGHQPPHAAVIEQEVDVIVLGEITAQLDEEPLQLAQDGRFEVFLAVGPKIGVAEDEVRGEAVLLAQIGHFLAGQLGGFP